MLKKLFIPLFTLALAIPLAFASKQYDSAKAVVVENSGDGFYLSDTSYSSSESFVYTAVANFESGQAAALVIGGSENDHYWVFNVDRIDNRAKMLAFYKAMPMDENFTVKEIYTEYFIGNDKTTESEFNVIRPKLAACNQFNLKLVLTVEDSHAYVEFFIDNIK